MTAAEPPLSVRRHDPGSYLVRSQRPACEDWYLVQLTEPGFPHGHCSCQQFQFRIEPFVCRNLPPEWGVECIHIRAVRSEIEHVATLCAAAGIETDLRLIPLHGR